MSLTRTLSMGQEVLLICLILVIAGLYRSLGSRKAARHGDKEILHVVSKLPVQQSPLVFRPPFGKSSVVVGAARNTILLALRGGRECWPQPS